MDKHIVVILNGTNGAGKDSFVNEVEYIIDHEESIPNLNPDNIMVSHISSINAIKIMLKSAEFWDGVKDERGRKLLSDVKDAIDNYNKNLITNKMTSVIDVIIANNDDRELASLIFMDIREPENIERAICKLKELEDVKVYTVLIKGAEEPVANNSGDMNVDKHSYDYTYTLVHDRPGVLTSCAKNFIYDIYGIK